MLPFFADELYMAYHAGFCAGVNRPFVGEEFHESLMFFDDYTASLGDEVLEEVGSKVLSQDAAPCQCTLLEKKKNVPEGTVRERTTFEWTVERKRFRSFSKQIVSPLMKNDDFLFKVIILPNSTGLKKKRGGLCRSKGKLTINVKSFTEKTKEVILKVRLNGCDLCPWAKHDFNSSVIFAIEAELPKHAPTEEVHLEVLTSSDQS